MVTKLNAARAVPTILNRSKYVTQGTHRGHSEDGRKETLGGIKSGSKLIEKCMKCRAIRNSTQTESLEGSSSSLNHQNSEMFYRNSKLQIAYN